MQSITFQGCQTERTDSGHSSDVAAVVLKLQGSVRHFRKRDIQAPGTGFSFPFKRDAYAQLCPRGMWLPKSVHCHVTKGNISEFYTLTSNLLGVSGKVSMHLLLEP